MTLDPNRKISSVQEFDEEAKTYSLAKSVLGLTGALMLWSCASGYEAPQSRIDPQTGQKITVIKAQNVPEKMVETNKEGEEVICRTDAATGSRIKKRRICATQAEWDAVDDNKNQAIRDMQNAQPFRNDGG